MREIKFRAWDKNKNRFLKNGEMLLGNIIAWKNNKEFSVGYTSDYEIMQYTGLKDKNGKEIYEGDIMKVLDRDWSDAEKDTKILIVYYRNDRYILINKAGIEESEKSEPNIYSKEWYEVSLFREYGRDKFEIIGNIYENPKLLTKENK